MDLKKATMVNMSEVLTNLRIAETVLKDCGHRIHTTWSMDTDRLKSELTYVKEMLDEHILLIENQLIEDCGGKYE